MTTLLLGILAISTICLTPTCETSEPYMVPELEDPIVIIVSEESEQKVISEQEATDQVTENDEDAESEKDLGGVFTAKTKDSDTDQTESASEEESPDRTIPEEEPPEEPSKADEKLNSEPVTDESEPEPVPENVQAEESRDPEQEEMQETEEKEVPETEKQPEEQAPEQAHVHSWVDITETIHHEAVYETVPVYEEQEILDEEAWDEEVPTGEYIYSCLWCSFETMDLQTMGEHCLDEDHSYTCRQLTETVHHEAVYHVETVQVGEEKVLVKEAWDEEVVTGRKCSECGLRTGETTE